MLIGSMTWSQQRLRTSMLSVVDCKPSEYPCVGLPDSSIVAAVPELNQDSIYSYWWSKMCTLQDVAIAQFG